MDKLDGEIIAAKLKSEQLGFPHDRDAIIALYQGLGYVTGTDIGERYDRLFPDEKKPAKKLLTLPGHRK